MEIFLFLGQVFGSANIFTGLGIFVDTYPNDDKQHEVNVKHEISNMKILYM